MILLMEILKIYLEQQLLIKYYVMKYLALIQIRNKIDINVDFIHWFIKGLIKRLLLLVQINLLVVELKVKFW